MNDTAIPTEQDWQRAKAHFDEVEGHYKDCVGLPGVNVHFALQFTFDPIRARYNRGERTQGLYDEMMSVES